MLCLFVPPNPLLFPYSKRSRPLTTATSAPKYHQQNRVDPFPCGGQCSSRAGAPHVGGRDLGNLQWIRSKAIVPLSTTKECQFNNGPEI